MKKTYMIPTIQVVEVKPAQFIANSPNPGIDPDQSTGTMDARRSRFSTWDEEEE